LTDGQRRQHDLNGVNGMKERGWTAWLLAVTCGLALGMGMACAQEEGPILLPKPKPIARPAGPTLLVMCDLACNWKLDGKARGRIAAGDSTTVSVSLGQHLVNAVTMDGLDTVENEIEITAAGQTIARIALKPVREARLNAGQEATEKPKPAAGSTLRVMCDLACNWKLDGEAKGQIDFGSSAKENVELGQHIVAAETLNELDKVEKEIEVTTAGQTIARIALLPVREARLKTEQQARDKAEREARDKAAKEARDKAAQDARDKAAREKQEKEQKEREQAAQAEAAGLIWTDPATHLIWTKTDNGRGVTWQEAAYYCKNLQLAGHGDWRLPTINELQGIYDREVGGNHVSYYVKGNLQLSGSDWSSTQGDSSASPAIGISLFGASRAYSGSTPSVGFWIFDFHSGKAYSTPSVAYHGATQNISKLRALCVRRSGE
jgi:antitoxin (DNA-binding transcriptional repressor) of toxin-antitoxin stability system